jgi:ABC-2 type transport system permease protein
MTSAPIADLKYRNYDGALENPRFRWWVISKQTIRQAFSKKSMWWAVAFAGWYYLGMIFVLFVVDQMNQAAQSGLQAPGSAVRNNAMAAFMQRIVWKDQFVHGFSFGQMFFLIMALILGAGAIANDNRANALLVYLSKPCNKFDYLFGKWFGVFLPLLVVMAVPSLVFFAYGALSYREYGFFFQDPWLFPKLMLVLPIGAAFHASMVTGISAMFNQGRIAGATYAGIYFLTNFFTKAMTIAWLMQTERRGATPGPMLDVVKNLFYASVDGLSIGMAKAILGTDGSPYFGIPSDAKMVPAPPLWPVLGIIFAMSFISLAIAWRRIRAVEVVG